MGRNTLSSNERIKHSNEITTLIRQGQAFFLAPFKVYYSWGQASEEPNVRAAFAVPKRKFGKAVKRNKLKRLSREGFRVQKSVLGQFAYKKGEHVRVLFMYQQTKELSYKEIYTAIGESIAEIIRQNG